MDFEYAPEVAIERLCKHHQTTPTRLLAAMLKALGRFRLRGFDAFPDLQPNCGPNGEELPPDIHAELQALMICQEPPLDPQRCSVGSILDGVIMCINYDQWLHETRASDLAAIEQGPGGEKSLSDEDWVTMTLDSQHARDDAVLMLVLKECCNQLDAIKLELELREESET